LKTFHGALSRGAFTVTAELSWIDQFSAADYSRQASVLTEHVDGIQLGENLSGHAEISPIALAAPLLQEGIDLTPLLHCRDRNRIALQSEILGLRAIGVTSLILGQGQEMPADGQASARPVFDVNDKGLIEMAREIDENRLLIGIEDHVPAAGSDWNVAALLERSAAGARFLRLRPCFDPDRLRSHLAGLVHEKVTWHYSVIPSLVPQQQGVDTCAQMIRDVKSIPGVSGVNLVCHDDPGLLISSLQSSGIRSGA
jgi:methylenetetrahydrofolate reductase (NADPH)